MCGEDKPLTEYHVARRNKDGRLTTCKTCRAEQAAADYVARPAVYAERRRNVDTTKRRDARLRRHYGITVAQFDELLAAQGGVCAMCKRPPKSKSLNVDHDHKTGLVRGLLCWHCNSRVIGGARDDIDLLRAGVAYLESPPAVAVLGEVYGRTGRITKKRRKRKTLNS